MQTALTDVFWHLRTAFLAGLGLVLLRMILTIVLKDRVAPGLAPDRGPPQDFFPRLVALIGINARAAETLGTHRLRATRGLLALSLATPTGFLLLHLQMQAPLFGPESLIVAVTGLFALRIATYEISYDKTRVILPRWWFGRSTRRWEDLLAITDCRPWTMTFHFLDGSMIDVQKYIVGRDAFVEVARKSTQL